MRQTKIIVTKNHFLYIAASNEKTDELWAGLTEYEDANDFYQHTTNTIGFILNGTTNAFVRNANSNWDAFASISSPSILMRKNFYNVGLVTSSDTGCLFGGIQHRNHVMSGQNRKIVNPSATDKEKSQIRMAGNSLELMYMCKARAKRDVNTFEIIDPPVADINIIPDSEVEIEGT